MALPVITRNQVSQGRGFVNDEASRYAASAYSQLAQSARVVGDLVRKREIEAGQEEGSTAFAMAAADAQPGESVSVPTRKGGLLDALGVKDEAYYQTVQTLQVTRAEKDAARALLDIRGETVGAPQQFEQAAREWKQSYLSGLNDPAVVAAVDAELDKQIEKTYLDIAEDRQKTDIKEARAGMDAKLAGIESDMDALLREYGGDAAAMGEFIQLNADRENLLSIKADNPLYAYSDDERDLDDAKFERRVQTAVLTPQIRRVYDEEGYAAALEAVDEVAGSLGLDGAEAVSMRSSLRNELNLMQQVDAAKEAEEAARDKRRKDYLKDVKDREERNFIDTLNNPEISQEDKLADLREIRDLLSPDEYSGYLKDITGGSDGLPVNQYAELRNMARAGELSRDDLPNLRVSQSQLNTLVSDVDKYQSSVAKAGMVVLDGGFKQGAFDFDPSFAAIGAEAEAEYDRWLDENPEATAEQARVRAREIAAERGRNMAVTKYSAYLDYNEKAPDESFNAAEDAILDADLEPNEAAEELRKLEQIRALIGN